MQPDIGNQIEKELAKGTRKEEFMKRFGLTADDPLDEESANTQFHALRSEEENKGIDVRHEVFNIIA